MMVVTIGYVVQENISPHEGSRRLRIALIWTSSQRIGNTSLHDVRLEQDLAESAFMNMMSVKLESTTIQ